MSPFKKLSVIAGALIIGFGATTAAHSDAIPDEQWNLPMNGPGQEQAELMGIKIAGSATGIKYPSYIFMDKNGNGKQSDLLLCSTVTDAVCGEATHIGYQAYIPPCSDSISVDCISGVTAISAAGTEVHGTFVQKFPTKVDSEFQGDPSRHLPPGSEPSVWSIPGVIHGGGSDTYLIKFLENGSGSAHSNFHTNLLDASMYPVTTRVGNFTQGFLKDPNHPNVGCVESKTQSCNELGFNHGGDAESLSTACVSFDTGLCALRQAFPEGYRFKVSVKLSEAPTGWFHGRIYSPNIGLENNGGITTLTVEAGAVKVPAVGTYIKQSEMTPEMKQYYSTHRPGGAFGNPGPTGVINLISLPAPSDSTIFDEYAMWLPILKDQASAVQSEWSFKTLDLGGQNNPCFNDKTKLVGIVSTNAMIYSAGAPSFNKSEGSLDYKVGAPHFGSKGEVFKGSYDLQLRSDVARCLYGFSSAPIKATISIANENSDSNVATTSVTEDKATGWLRMSATNFTFSNPTIKVKLNQDAPVPVASPVPSVSSTTSGTPGTASSKPATKLTIKCSKGKVTKSVTGIKPTCPSGFKKK